MLQQLVKIISGAQYSIQKLAIEKGFVGDVAIPLLTLPWRLCGCNQCLLRWGDTHTR
jgi:hypothetical protein